jgi:amino acid adenylation domain-containing protein
VLFILQNTPTLPVELPDLTATLEPSDTGTAKFDLTLEIRETPQGFGGTLEYDTDLFEADTISRLLACWQILLTACVADPDQPIADMPLLTESERQLLLVKWNATQADYPQERCLPEIFEDQVERTPDAIAVVYEDEQLTYADLHRRANQLAHYLHHLGVGPEVRVGLCLDRSPALLISLLAILQAGGAYVPLDPSYPQERLRFLLTDAQVALLLSQQALLSRLPPTPVPLLSLEHLWPALAAQPATPPLHHVQGEQLAYLIYTSGSTGVPKGVAIPHRALLNCLLALRQPLGLLAGERLLALTTLAFDIAALELFLPLTLGACVHLVPRSLASDGSRLATLLAHSAASALQATPTTWHLLLASGWTPPPSLSLWCGGEILSPDLARALLAGGATLYHLYGPTETTIWSSLHPVTSPTAISLGTPLANTRFYLLDAHLHPVPLGVVGDLYIAGAGLARGYWQQPDRTAERFVPDPFSAQPGGRLYATGDRARFHPDGSLQFLGRRDTQVKLRGYRLELGEIESVLHTHPGVQQCAVVLHDQAGTDQRLVAYVVASAPHPLSSRDLRQFLQQSLPDYMLPASFVFLDALPLTPNGKLDRRALPAPPQERPELEAGYVAPRTPTEQHLARLWADLLRVEQVGLHDNFFELGGHSLLATQLVYGVRNAFQVEISLLNLFETPTVAGLASSIAQRKAVQTEDVPALTSLPTLAPAADQQYLPFPLTDIQQAYWVGRNGMLELSNVSTHVYQEIEMSGFDLERATHAWQCLIDRHGMLRAIVLPEGQQQILEKVPPYRIETLDLRGQAAEAVESQLAAVRQQMSHQVLPADQWPLFEIRASLLDDQRVRLHVSTDALTIDAWSCQVLAWEFLQLYQNPEATLPPLELSFRDYVMAEVAFRDSEAYRRSETYWRERLPQLPPTPALPLAKDPALLTQPHFVRRYSSLEPELWQKLRNRGARAGLTPSGILLAAFAEVLAVWSKSQRFTINLTLFNRLPLHPQVSNLVGDFTSVTLLAVDNSVPDTFETRARRIQEQLWKDLDHRYFSGVRVLRELARSQGGMARAIMPVVFTSILSMNRSSSQEIAPSGTQGKITYNISQTPQVWLDHQVFDLQGTLIFNWDAVEDLFPEGLLDDMFSVYCRLLLRLANDEESWRESTRSLIPQEQLEQRAVVNATEGPVSSELLHTLFAAQVSQRARQTAVISSRGTFTYEELYQRSNRLGRWLRQEGARPNTLVGVVMEKGWEQIVAVLGILSSGAAYLPIDPGLPAERLRYHLENGQVQIVLTQSRLDEKLAWPEDIQRFCVDREDLADRDDRPLEPVQGVEDLAYVIYTSGSTGLPKGVMIPHLGAVNTILDVNRRLEIGPQDRLLALSSLSFDLSVYDIFGTLAAGGTIIIPDASAIRDPASWADLLIRERITVWNSVPALMEMLVDYAGDQLPTVLRSVRLVMLSGDWIPVSLPARIKELMESIQVVSLGGPTETSIWSIIYPLKELDPAWRSIPYGKPLANQRIYVLNETLEPCPVWVPGELYIGGLGLARGYWRDEEKTRARFITHPHTGERLYRSGDLGRYLPDGTIEFLGREDFQIKLQGHRIELGEIETALGQHPAVRSAVVAAKGEGHEKRLVAYVVPHRKQVFASDKLREFLKEQLPNYMLPSAFVPLDTLPLTPNGKVNRMALPDPASSIAAESHQEVKTEQSVLAEPIARLVTSILKVDTIDDDADLLELGATSVDMIRILNLLGKELGFRPKIDEFYRSPTVAWLARSCEETFLHPKIPSAKESPIGGLAPETLVASFEAILDPEERQAFKKRQPGLRTENGGKPSVQLTITETDEEFREKYARRRSYRQFVDRPIPFEQFSKFMSCLRQTTVEDEPRYLYPSAGGLYPVQAYLYIKPGRVEGLSAGTYYYHPGDHRLVLISADARIDRSIHEWINQPIFDASAFSLFLICQLRAIAPMYGKDGVHFAVLEAGYLSQLLMTSATASHIGLCPMGRVDFERIRDLFALEESHLFVHSLLGGLIDSSAEERWTLPQATYHYISRPGEDREEVEF